MSLNGRKYLDELLLRKYGEISVASESQECCLSVGNHAHLAHFREIWHLAHPPSELTIFFPFEMANIFPFKMANIFEYYIRYHRV